MTTIREQFERDGFYLAKGVFTGDTLTQLQEDYDRVVAQLQNSGEDINARWCGAAAAAVNTESDVIVHTHNIESYSAHWMRALFNQQFLDPAQGILGPDIVLHHTKLFQKPSEHGGGFPMHQDWGYFPTVNDSMIAGVVHVADATDEMGCFRVYPGSHRLGRLDGMMGNSDEANTILEQYPLEGSTVLEAEAGDVLFFHYFLLHGSMPNRSAYTRKTVLVQMHAGDDRMENEGGHPYAKLTLSGWNYAATRNSSGAMR